jgi:hypothetical protein
MLDARERERLALTPTLSRKGERGRKNGRRETGNGRRKTGNAGSGSVISRFPIPVSRLLSPVDRVPSPRGAARRAAVSGALASWRYVALLLGRGR